MKHVYRPERKSLPFLAGIIIFVLAGPALYFPDTGEREELLVFAAAVAVIYLAFSPLVYVLVRLVIYLFSASVTIGGEGAAYVSRNRKIFIPWDGVKRFSLAGVRGDAGRFIVCRLEGDAGGFRFYRTADSFDDRRGEVFASSEISRMKLLDVETLGIYLGRKKFDILLAQLRDYSGMEPERE